MSDREGVDPRCDGKELGELRSPSSFIDPNERSYGHIYIGRLVSTKASSGVLCLAKLFYCPASISFRF